MAQPHPRTFGDSPIPAYYRNQLSRRLLLKGMGASALLAGLAACGSGQEGETGLSEAAEGQAATGGGSETLNMMCWDGYDAPAVWQPFAQERGVDFNFDLVVDSPGAFAKLQGGGHRNFDLIAVDSPWIRRLGPAGLAEMLDPEEWQATTSDFFEPFQLPFSPLAHEGQQTGLPTRFGLVGLPLNSEHTSEDEFRSYDALFADANRGKIGVMDWGDWPIVPLALHAGIDPYQEMDESAVEEMRDVFRALFRQTRAFFTDNTVAQEALLDGSVKTLLGAGTYVTSGPRMEGLDNIYTVVPQPQNGMNQGIVWIEGMAIVSNPSNPELAADALRHYVSPQAAYELTMNPITANPSPNSQVEYTDEERETLQLDYMFEVWDDCVIHDFVPTLDRLLTVWEEERAQA